MLFVVCPFKLRNGNSGIEKEKVVENRSSSTVVKKPGKVEAGLVRDAERENSSIAQFAIV